MSFSRGPVILGVMMGNVTRKRKKKSILIPFFFFELKTIFHSRVEKRGHFMTLHQNQELLWRNSDFHPRKQGLNSVLV